jgi:hypothetical protein
MEVLPAALWNLWSEHLISAVRCLRQLTFNLIIHEVELDVFVQISVFSTNTSHAMHALQHCTVESIFCDAAAMCYCRKIA